MPGSLGPYAPPYAEEPESPPRSLRERLGRWTPVQWGVLIVAIGVALFFARVLATPDHSVTATTGSDTYTFHIVNDADSPVYYRLWLDGTLACRGELGTGWFSDTAHCTSPTPYDGESHALTIRVEYLGAQERVIHGTVESAGTSLRITNFGVERV